MVCYIERLILKFAVVISHLVILFRGILLWLKISYATSSWLLVKVNFSSKCCFNRFPHLGYTFCECYCLGDIKIEIIFLIIYFNAIFHFLKLKVNLQSGKPVHPTNFPSLLVFIINNFPHSGQKICSWSLNSGLKANLHSG